MQLPEAHVQVQVRRVPQAPPDVRRKGTVLRRLRRRLRPVQEEALLLKAFPVRLRGLHQEGEDRVLPVT